MMLKDFKYALILFGLLTIITGLAYPLSVTLVSQLVFSHQANGSMMFLQGQMVGSEWIGQYFDDAKYFWGRPSATSGMPYNAAVSSGSNLAPSNPLLIEQVGERIREIKAKHPASPGLVPIDLVTASGSGLDPHISLAAARYQIARVAQARQIDVREVSALVSRYTEPRQWGIFGETRVNVLKINLALDEIQ